MAAAHDHGAGDAHGSGDLGDPDQDGHATGAHSLMHQSGGPTMLTQLVASISVPMIYAPMPDLPIPDANGIPYDVSSIPFRPPIA